MALQHAKGEDRLIQQRLIASGPIPRHIAIIMDGNGRWAKKKGFPRIAGHQEGVNSVRDITEACGQLGVKYLTLYAFSTENWKRPQEEVSFLMRLILKALRDERDRLYRNGVKLKAIGNIASMPKEVQNELIDAMNHTADNTGLTLILALSYSGRWDITHATRRMMRDLEMGKISPDDVTEELLASYLSTREFEDPDLLIRTSGEMRISNFLLWQVAYAELFISKQNWPDFRRESLYEAIADYQKRERRFGMTSEQLKQQPATYTEPLVRSAAKY